MTFGGDPFFLKTLRQPDTFVDSPKRVQLGCFFSTTYHSCINALRVKRVV